MIDKASSACALEVLYLQRKHTMKRQRPVRSETLRSVTNSGKSPHASGGGVC